MREREIRERERERVVHERGMYCRRTVFIVQQLYGILCLIRPESAGETSALSSD